MNPRPTRFVIALQLLAIAAAGVVVVLRAPESDWDPALVGTLIALGAISDLLRIEVRSNRVFVSASFLAVILTAVFAGPSPAAVAGVTTILIGWVRDRYRLSSLLINVVTYAWFPLIAGITFSALTDTFDIATGSTLFYLLVFGTFVLGLAIDFVLIAGFLSYVDGTRFRDRVQTALVPILPSELASALLTVAIAAA